MAAKRHHHMKHRDGHSMMHEGHYEGHAGRRKQEMEDGGMIHEDHSAIANLPQEVRITPYPKYGANMPDGLDDTIRGIDNQMGADDSQRDARMKPHKY